MNNKPVHDVAFRKRWASRRDRCQACGIPRSRAPWPFGLQVHHLIRRSRPDEPTAMLLLDSLCHDLCHGARVSDGNGGYLPTLSLGAQLALKRLRDPDEYDADRLRELRHGEELPDLEPVPEWFLQQWERWTKR